MEPYTGGEEGGGRIFLRPLLFGICPWGTMGLKLILTGWGGNTKYWGGC